MTWRTAIIFAGLALLGPPAASAAQISITEAGGSKFPERSYVLQVDPPVALAKKDISVRENGAPVQGLEVSSAAGSRGGEFASILVIDASLSVRGEAIGEAMRAARAFAAHRAPGQELGVIAFNGSRQVLLPLTADEEAIAQALAKAPKLAGGTRLYDAVGAAITQLSDAGVEAGSVVILSDGADTGSRASEEAVVRRAAAAGVRIFVVGLESGHLDVASLRALARAGGYTSASDPRQLAPIFSRFGLQRASEHLLRYDSRATPGERVTVQVRVAGVPVTARAGYVRPRLESATDGSPGGSSSGSGFWRSAAAMVIAALLVALIVGACVFAWIRPRRASVAARLAGFGLFSAGGGAEQVPQPGRDPGTGPLAGALAAIERPLRQTERWARFEEELQLAGIEVPGVQILVATVAATLLMMILIGAVAPFTMLALLGLAVPFAVRAIINRKLRGVRQEFADSLADNLQVVASAIRTGHSMVGALAVLVEEADEPAKEQFHRIVAAERVGVPLEDSIREVARRMENRDMEQLALVAIIQRETGGNTAEIIDRSVETIRERTELRRMMASLTAQGRLSRGIVTALPFILLVAISLINPSYIAPLFDTAGGQILLIVAGAMIVIGSLVMKRIVEAKV